MNIEYALLSLVKMHPDVTGYQIKSIVDQSTGRLTKLYLSNIYPALKRLTDKGLLTYREVPQSRRLPQKYYSLTDAGQESLDEWLREPFQFSTSSDNFSEYLLKLGAMAYMDNQDILDAIDVGIEFFAQQYAELGRAGRANDDLAFVETADLADKERYTELWTLEYELMAAEAKMRLDWLIETRKRYE